MSTYIFVPYIYGLMALLESTIKLLAISISTSLLHDRSLSSVARDESRMARDESRMTGGEPRMTGDCCRPEKSIHRCVRTHSHLYSYIYGLVALLDNIQSSFSKYHYLNNHVTTTARVIVGGS